MPVTIPTSPAAAACRSLLPLVALLLGVTAVPSHATAAEPTPAAAEPTLAAVDFQREVRPLLAGKCFACHGPDEAAQEAGLRLDQADSALEDRGGYQALVPGDHQASELWQRVVSEDDDLRMPPAGNHPPLTADEAAILARWIDQGGRYETHWAFTPPQSTTLPAAPAGSTPIDALMDRYWQQAGLEPAAAADRYALVRRVYLDLLGFPPTPQEADAFVQDQSPLAYPRLVDALLARPEYAERWARPWLDLARYADTNGYEKDRPRTIWPYRDWVIEALAADMPYDQFSIRQLAGDMLPNATDADRVATGFHRNTMLNEEGGIDPLEFRYLAMIDRVATTGTVWLGLTVGCAQCHTHKYDPITHTDFFALFGLLNGADEPEWELEDPDTADKQADLLAEIDQLETRLIQQWLASDAGEGGPADDDRAAIADGFQQSVRDQQRSARHWQVITPSDWQTTMPHLEQLPDGSLLASGDTTKREVYTLTFPPRQTPATAIRLEALPHESLPGRGPGMAYYEGNRGDFFLSELVIHTGDQPVTLVQPSASFGHNSLGSGSADAANVIDGEGSTGWATGGAEGQANRWVANFAEPLVPGQPWTIELTFERHYAAPLGRFRFSLTDDQPASGSSDGNAIATDSAVKAPAAIALRLDADTEHALAQLPANDADPLAHCSPELLKTLQRQFLATSELLKTQRQPLESLRRQLPQPVRTLVMQQRPAGQQRVTHRYHRGEYLHPREEVEAAIPEVFADDDGQQPRDRLQLAQWLVSDANPLFARVVVNRAWRDLFGRGIVHTAGDYGTQSEPPSHPELLDYLASEFVSQGMSVKRLHREIVLSDAYQRDHRLRQQRVAVDPENRLLADGPRRRLDGERIRDSLLAASGLLVRNIGGASVYPPQPASVTAAAYGHVPWNASAGGDRFRRSLYTFAKRTAPFAALLVFDGPTGEACLPRRETSNSPLQALTLLNDAMFLEIAQALADETLRQWPTTAESSTNQAAEDPNAQIATAMFRRLLVRPPTADELTAILQYHDQVQQHSDQPWMWVARALINLDEVITTP